jgi:hypothetical protein
MMTHFHCTPFENCHSTEPPYVLESFFGTCPLGFLTETLLATEEYWEQLPGLAPLLLREGLAALMEVAS